MVDKKKKRAKKKKYPLENILNENSYIINTRL